MPTNTILSLKTSAGMSGFSPTSTWLCDFKTSDAS